MNRNLLLECDAGQEWNILLSWVSHEDEVDISEGPCRDQVNLSANILLSRSSQNSYLVLKKKQNSLIQSFDIIISSCLSVIRTGEISQLFLVLRWIHWQSWDSGFNSISKLLNLSQLLTTSQSSGGVCFNCKHRWPYFKIRVMRVTLPFWTASSCDLYLTISMTSEEDCKSLWVKLKVTFFLSKLNN